MKETGGTIVSEVLVLFKFETHTSECNVHSPEELIERWEDDNDPREIIGTCIDASLEGSLSDVPTTTVVLQKHTVKERYRVYVA